MTRRYNNDMHAHIAYGEIRCSLISEGTAWNPDIAEDMVNRLNGLWFNTLQSLDEFGMLASSFDGDDEDDDDEFGPTPERELQDPITVYLEGDDLG